MTLSEALIKAEDLKKDKKASDIIELLSPFWKEKITTNVGALLAYAYRRNGAYDTCLQICDAVDKASNFPAKIKAQRQWCYIFRDIIHEESFDVAEAQAIKTITLLNVNSSYDFGVFKFICLARAKKNDLDAAIEWFERIPSNKLSNRTHSYTDEETGWVSRGISEKHSFYVRLIDRLKTEENIIYYINKLLSNFSNNNKTSFIEAIRKSISIINYKNEKSIRVKKLAGILMHIKESGHLVEGGPTRRAEPARADRRRARRQQSRRTSCRLSRHLAATARRHRDRVAAHVPVRAR